MRHSPCSQVNPKKLEWQRKQEERTRELRFQFDDAYAELATQYANERRSFRERGGRGRKRVTVFG